MKEIESVGAEKLQSHTQTHTHTHTDTHTPRLQDPRSMVTFFCFFKKQNKITMDRGSCNLGVCVCVYVRPCVCDCNFSAPTDSITFIFGQALEYVV